jgi:hypothetical protein
LGDRYVKTESFKTAQAITATDLDGEHQSVKQFRQTGNVNIPKRVRRSTADEGTATTEVREVREGLSARLRKSLRKHRKLVCRAVAVAAVAKRMFLGSSYYRTVKNDIILSEEYLPSSSI